MLMIVAAPLRSSVKVLMKYQLLNLDLDETSFSNEAHEDKILFQQILIESFAVGYTAVVLEALLMHLIQSKAAGARSLPQLTGQK